MRNLDEISRRSRVWCALSELYLDTQLTDADLTAIARTIQSAGFTADEAETILKEEVAPVFWTNHLQVAGEWQPFAPDQVEQLVQDRLERKSRNPIFRMLREFWNGVRIRSVKHDWHRIKQELRREYPDGSGSPIIPNRP